MPARRRPITDVYPATVEERRLVAAVLDWITDGEPLTTQAERDRHEADMAWMAAAAGRVLEPV